MTLLRKQNDEKSKVDERVMKKNKQLRNQSFYTLDLEAFGEFIERLRIAKGMSVDELIEVTGISQPTLYRIRTGENIETSGIVTLIMWSGVDIREFIRQRYWPKKMDVPEGDNDSDTLES